MSKDIVLKIKFYFIDGNRWVQYVTSADNRHALPMLTSLLNTVCGYDPIGMGVPYNHLLFAHTSEPLVDVCLQILIVALDSDMQQVELNRNLNIVYIVIRTKKLYLL